MPAKKKKPSKPEVFTPGPEHLANDPSLRWVTYRKMESVWSDAHSCIMRFISVEGGLFCLATEAGGKVVDGLVNPLSVRRSTAHDLRGEAVRLKKFQKS